jgi:hypothetical protein
MGRHRRCDHFGSVVVGGVHSQNGVTKATAFESCLTYLHSVSQTSSGGASVPTSTMASLTNGSSEDIGFHILM